MAIGVAISLSACIPPSIEDLTGGEATELIDVSLELVKPPGDRVTLTRSSPQIINFDVRSAFLAPPNEDAKLFYYWYLDWSADTYLDPLPDELSSKLQYVTCTIEYDPPNPSDGTRPDTRKLMVVVSTRELERPEEAYLGVAEDGDVTFYDWTLEFQTEAVCAGT